MVEASALSVRSYTATASAIVPKLQHSSLSVYVVASRRKAGDAEWGYAHEVRIDNRVGGLEAHPCARTLAVRPMAALTQSARPKPGVSRGLDV